LTSTVALANGEPNAADVQTNTTLDCDGWLVVFTSATYNHWDLLSTSPVQKAGDWAAGSSQTVSTEFRYEHRRTGSQVVIEPMVEVIRSEECAPLPSPKSSTSDKGQIVIPMMWILKDSDGRHCIIISDTHPSVERHQALCWTDFAAVNAPCAAPVLSRFQGDELGSWHCDHHTPWRLELIDLRKVD